MKLVAYLIPIVTVASARLGSWAPFGRSSQVIASSTSIPPSPVTLTDTVPATGEYDELKRLAAVIGKITDIENSLLTKSHTQVADSIHTVESSNKDTARTISSDDRIGLLSRLREVALAVQKSEQDSTQKSVYETADQTNLVSETRTGTATASYPSSVPVTGTGTVSVTETRTGTVPVVATDGEAKEEFVKLLHRKIASKPVRTEQSPSDTVLINRPVRTGGDIPDDVNEIGEKMIQFFKYLDERSK